VHFIERSAPFNDACLGFLRKHRRRG